jgi:hypothetical protein
MERLVARRWLARGVILAAALAIGVSAAPPRTAAPAAVAALVPSHRPSDLPTALQVSLSQEPVTLVAAIATDIDADGDLDIVGSDEQLGLVVLVNDGHDHLSRRASRRPSNAAAGPEAPAMNSRGGARAVSVQNEPPTVNVDAVRTFGADDRERSPRLSRRSPAAAEPISPGVPRAPPAAHRG